jgi:hypothetical protein
MILTPIFPFNAYNFFYPKGYIFLPWKQYLFL